MVETILIICEWFYFLGYISNILKLSKLKFPDVGRIQMSNC